MNTILKLQYSLDLQNPKTIEIQGLSLFVTQVPLHTARVMGKTKDKASVHRRTTIAQLPCPLLKTWQIFFGGEEQSAIANKLDIVNQ